MDLQKLITDWAKATLPADANHLAKLREEYDELARTPSDPFEMADVLLALLLHAERHTAFGCSTPDWISFTSFATESMALAMRKGYRGIYRKGATMAKQLSEAQKRLLLIVAGKHPIRRRERDGTFMPCNHESRTVASLEKSGLLQWVKAGHDGYAYNGVVITDAGLRAITN